MVAGFGVLIYFPGIFTGFHIIFRFSEPRITHMQIMNMLPSMIFLVFMRVGSSAPMFLVFLVTGYNSVMNAVPIMVIEMGISML